MTDSNLDPSRKVDDLTPTFRMMVEERQTDGEWGEVGTVLLDDYLRQQLALLLSGVDLAAYAAMSDVAQQRALDGIGSGRSPRLAMN